MPLQLVRNDITKMKVDAIVNAANTALKRGGGVCGAIFSAAGAKELQAECDRIGGCKVGEAVISKGYNLPAKYIIHTVGPVWQGGHANEAQLLHNCYINSLNLALKHKCESIAFPLISSGIFGYPKDQALHVAISAISEFLLNNEANVYLVLFDKNAVTLSEKLFTAITEYIDDHYVDERLLKERHRGIEYVAGRAVIRQDEVLYSPSRSLEDVLGQLDETFSEMLLRLIDEKGLTDVETYKRANIDRKLFSKIRSNKDYHPSKATALALAIALKLNLDETLDLLSKAGYTLSPSSKFDVIIQYFIEEGNYNIFEINEALFYFEQATLGS
ncbi:MAG: macro domain-containing protein [Syntrophomonadaceae bacterium]|jgi:O-acetyl-ADP-ribose deacetylase (regulator of RNase III)/transcriptional regulator with XRE-family HTH domain|nr:macro domain-containing protein [Syntrophomonadaceae bacterium]HQA50581.1 macro domain-containing protein [Syntrophomonadaceae bacterium]HQD91100.1 macro domain-containing protein [Syntrophomonadaceae bacterium]